MLLPNVFALWLGIRPKTLSLSVMPILTAWALADFHNMGISYPVLIAIVFGAISIQIATNLFNDAHDYLNGTDQKDRIGPTRITQAGLATATQTRNAAFLFLIIAALSGLYLMIEGGLLIAGIGLVSVLCAYGYSAGPYPISRSPFGELFVFIFFGLIAFNTSYFLLTEIWPEHGIFYGLAIGAPACAILLLNNYRDLENDKIAGRKTLAIVLGEKQAQILYSGLMVLPYPILLSIAPNQFHLTGALITLFALYRFWNITDKSDLNGVLAISALSQIVMCSSLSIALFWQ
ncbi:1,4-Dihydroxy-2-naphtoate prenyltransferase [Candidatus Terasakiella magnetica]|uniref:1,4-dihydroxy-2-naphthoate octaprenyltransferase n=1 Tax=Candidatus Terasakiella magnetica TaxID=1867952 RepID=A0A1C3RBX0_9PROT|nr:1,4-dihydroxy-2-naphthoate octaprenyltransferase [Candidatus Terasakiella magnetica]SCA54777.1 1,4-Dihydroxy-2-naphtoate prenyltransferase [Candidatus Terasakiella magnetica]